MKIIFSPEYSGYVFVKPENGGSVMMDTVVVNTAGLVSLLELRLGLHHETLADAERLALYYDAVCQYMKANPDNVLARSFANAGLNTAKAMMAWRDELRGAGWDADGAEVSERIAALVEVEMIYQKKSDCDLAGRMHIVDDHVAFQKLDCSGMELIMNVDKEMLKPAVKRLIDVLEGHGATITNLNGAEMRENNLCRVRHVIENGQKEKIRLDCGDDSIEIWHFSDDRAAYEYLAYMGMEDVDVWINSDNKQMDNWLRLMGKALTGSVANGCTPQLTQMFVTGLGLFAEPMNVNTLIEWLNMPIHPMSPRFCRTLAATIVNEGGYRNEACAKIVKRFVEGEFTVYKDQDGNILSDDLQEVMRKKGVANREKQVGLFLPPMEPREEISTEDVKRFVAELGSWARQRSHLMGLKESDENKLWVEQLAAVAGMCDGFLILLDTVKEDVIEYKTIDSWLSTVYQAGCYTNAVAEKGCRCVVDSPAKIASVAGTTVWIGVDGDTAMGEECGFLYPSEKNRLTKTKTKTKTPMETKTKTATETSTETGCLDLWDESRQNQYHERMMMTPLRMTSGRLILVVRDRIDGEPTMKHPLIVRLEEQVENIDVIVRRPVIGEDERVAIAKVDHGTTDAELEFEHQKLIKWPEKLSPTGISTLVQHPFDYLMERLLNITNDGQSQMADVQTTKGNVAHAVIEALFAPRGGAAHTTDDEIEERLAREFESVFDRVVEANGAILLLAENQLGEKLLKEQLLRCLETLAEIVRTNGLRVTGCEKHVERDEFTGYVDMTLEDADGTPVVFDFKWTTWHKGYREKLKENRSVQLEMYRWMLADMMHREVKKVAYFLMPEGHLYSKERFVGSNCTQIDAENNINIVEQLKRSIEYRKRQINGGVVETNGAFEELGYVKDTAANGLYALKRAVEDKKEVDMKERSGFSKYGLFDNYKIEKSNN